MEIVRRKQLKQKPEKGTQLGFGHYFTDYMFTMKYTAEKGWHDAKIEPNEPKPFDLAIRLVANFELDEEIWLAEDEREFITAATRATFPYLRSAITNLTAAAMINPLILPPIDGGALFPENKGAAEQSAE